MKTQLTKPSFHTEYLIKPVLRCRKASWWRPVSPVELDGISRSGAIHPWVSCVFACIQLWAALVGQEGLQQRLGRKLPVRRAGGVSFDGFDSCPRHRAVLRAVRRVSCVASPCCFRLVHHSRLYFSLHIPTLLSSPLSFPIGFLYFCLFVCFFIILYPVSSRNFTSISGLFELLTFH